MPTQLHIRLQLLCQRLSMYYERKMVGLEYKHDSTQSKRLFVFHSCHTLCMVSTCYYSCSARPNKTNKCYHHVLYTMCPQRHWYKNKRFGYKHDLTKCKLLFLLFQCHTSCMVSTCYYSCNIHWNKTNKCFHRVLYTMCPLLQRHWYKNKRFGYKHDSMMKCKLSFLLSQCHT